MLGYIKAYKPEMTFREFETYKAVYCSLCREIGKTYGVTRRVLLSYDFTCLALILMAVEHGTQHYEKKRCVCNPLKGCNYCSGENRQISYAAAVTMALCEFKAADDIDDEGFFKRLPRKLAHPFLRRSARRAYKAYPALEDVILRYKEGQREVQSVKCDSIDRAAEPSAAALGEIFSLNTACESEKRILYRLGYCLGKWIYLLDAGEDIEDDIKKGSFNPLKPKLASSKEENPKKFAEDYLTPNLTVCEVECEKAFELLDVKKFRTLLENIFYLGLKNTRINVFKGKNKTNKNQGVLEI